MTTRAQVKIFPTQNPWFNSTVRVQLLARDSALLSGDKEAYRKARADMNRGIILPKQNIKSR